jgi:hypothetical protein
MYKSTDAGKTWQHIGLRNAGAIGRIQIHPTNPNIVYVAVLGNLFAPSKERGVYRSRDGGATWELVHFLSDRTGAVDLALDMKNPDVLFAAMWTVERKAVVDRFRQHRGRSVQVGRRRFALAACRRRISVEGHAWQDRRLDSRAPIPSASTPSSRPARIRAACSVRMTRVAPGPGRTPAAICCSARSTTRTSSRIPANADTVYAFNVGAFKSTDGGKTFGSAGINSHSDYHAMWINPKNSRAMVVGNDGGGTVSLNGSPWTAQENQATSEIYRLTVDTRAPYWVYGAQQDNNTVAVPSQGNAETYGVGGGESGYIAVDPRDYNIVYAGNYGGTISRIDRKFNTSENVKVYADMETGQQALDMKYRFQWNSPIRISPNNPDIVYTTSQFVHRTRNGGLDWEVISPDLTRNDKRRLGYSGGEGITRDSTGVEVTAPSSRSKSHRRCRASVGGSDDGLVHISRDNGKNWKNITPPGLPEGCVNVIDLSAHDPGRAHIAVYRYRQGDQTPYIYQTSDYGASWKRLADGTNGIPANHFVRVVREDPVRKGLLYAGTEFRPVRILRRWRSLAVVSIEPAQDASHRHSDLPGRSDSDDAGPRVLHSGQRLGSERCARRRTATRCGALQTRGRISFRRAGPDVLLLVPRSADGPADDRSHERARQGDVHDNRAARFGGASGGNSSRAACGW